MKRSRAKRIYIKLSGLFFLFLTAAMIGLAVFLPRLIDVNAYRDDIITTLEKSLNRKVTFASGEFSLRFGPSFIFDNVTVKERDDSNDFIKAERITIHLALLPLLEKKIVLTELKLEGTEVNLVRGRDKKLNIDDLLKPQPDSAEISFKKIQIKNGVLKWRDMAVQKEDFTATLKGINIVLDKISRGHKGNFKISCELATAAGTSSLVSLNGTAKLPEGAASLLETEFNAETDIENADAGLFWPYYGRHIPFGNPGGRLSLASSFKGKLREFSAKGKLRLNGVAITWPTIFRHTVNPRSAQLDYEFKLDKNSIDMPTLLFSAEGFKVKGDCKLLDINSPDLRIIANATTETFRLEELRQWIPYGIIADDVADYIEEHITGGLFKLEIGKLDGRISQITHMEKDTNYNVLHIKGTVEKGIVSYGKNVPAFNNIKAGLEMLGKDFILSNVNARFGDSPFTMEGRITDYPLDTPCQYPFKMQMVPCPAEVAWLSKIVGTSKLEFSGNSTLNLTGGGFISAYRLGGEWELRQAAYSFPGAIRKLSGSSNHLTFSSVIGPAETKLTSLTYTLSPLALSATATLKYGNQPHLGFELQTNRFQLNEKLPILAMWQQYHPKGRVQAHIIGKGNPEDFAAMDYSGAIFLNSFSLQPGENLKPVSNINGNISFKGSSLETSSINVLYGSSMLNVKGRIKNFKNREAEINLSSPQFFLRDAKLAQPTADTSIRRMSASMILQDNKYTIQSFSGMINTSNFNISGSYINNRTPEADLTITSGNLDIDDLLLLGKMGELDDNGQDRQTGPQLNLKLSLAVEAGKYDKLSFSKLHANISRDSGVIYLQNLDALLVGGRIAAKGRIAPGGAQGTRYDLNFNLEHINADHFFQALDVTREVTGALNLTGDITARGNNLTEVKKTALGNVRLRLSNGSLRKFNVLSKVFSILNISQLLKLQLPDMVSGGMPFNQIKGSISIKDGIASSEDLFISSDAINMSIIGKTDIVKEELDLAIGVQPLQTVDKIVNRIPVVGWLLTGKDKSVLTAYFEAKGKWSDPKVTAIPVKSMAKGAFNVFRRVFELPVRLFTDTGEVILGN